jgi:hypothetical protein
MSFMKMRSIPPTRNGEKKLDGELKGLVGTPKNLGPKDT